MKSVVALGPSAAPTASAFPELASGEVRGTIELTAGGYVFPEDMGTGWYHVVNTDDADPTRGLHELSLMRLGEEVADAMTDFLAWDGEAQPSGMPPVELAAGAYQRMVSIHPFADANGRTSRMVMDYVLQQNGLPPATLADVNVAVFGGERALGIVDGASVTPEQALTKVTAGVERSLELLEALP